MTSDLGFFERAPESRRKPSAQVDQKGHLRVYPRVGGFGKPVQGMNRTVGETDQSEIKAFLPSVYAGCRASFWRPCRVGRVKT